MKFLYWFVPLCLALGLAAQESDTPDEASPFWEQAEKQRTGDPFSTVTAAPELDKYEPPGPPIPVMGQIVVFRTEDHSVVLEAMAGGRAAEPSVFARLLAMERDGAVSIVMEHQIMTIGGRESSASLIRPAVYPTEWQPMTNPLRLYPTAFETRSIGDSASVTPRFRNNGVHVVAQAAAVRWADPSRWPMVDPAVPPGPERILFCVQPHILVDECTTTAMAIPSEARLLAITSEALSVHDTTSPSAWRLTFLRAVPLDDSAAADPNPPIDAGQGVRCDVVVFRMPLDEAAAWVWQAGPRDAAAAWDRWMTQARTGEVTVAAQWTIAAVTGPIHPGGPPEASVSSIGEFTHPTDYHHCTPTAFDTRNTGRSCRFRLRSAADGQTLVGEMEASEVRLDRIRNWPTSADDPDACLRLPEFVSRRLRTDIVLPAHGVTFLGLHDANPFGADAEDSAAMADVYFIKTSGDPIDPPADAPTAPPVVEWRTLVFSIDAAAAADLQPLMDAEPAAIENDAGHVLWQLAADGRAHIRHIAAVVAADGGNASLSHLTEVIYPTADRSENGHVFFDGSEYRDSGLRLSCQPAVDPDQQTLTAAMGFAWASAPPRMPELAAYRHALDSGVRPAPIPEFYDSPEATRKTHVTLTNGSSRLLRLEKSRAPAGSPEHERWHAVLVNAFIRGG